MRLGFATEIVHRLTIAAGLVLAVSALAQAPAPRQSSLQQARSRPLFLPLLQVQPAPAVPSLAAPADAVALRLPLLMLARAPLGEAATSPQPADALMSVAVAPEPLPTAAPAPAPAAVTLDAASCKVYPNVRITWYELGSCCDKAPGHPEYGITRSGKRAEWGMGAVQARVPLLPMGTRFIVRDLGEEYVFVVADTGSETAFGSSWIDIFVPTIPLGHWVERQVADGRSDVLVCAAHN
jgi:3D (Asp-Asp-Asp) domain-containing protein